MCVLMKPSVHAKLILWQKSIILMAHSMRPMRDKLTIVYVCMCVNHSVLCTYARVRDMYAPFFVVV